MIVEKFHRMRRLITTAVIPKNAMVVESRSVILLEITKTRLKQVYGHDDENDVKLSSKWPTKSTTKQPLWTDDRIALTLKNEQTSKRMSEIYVNFVKIMKL